MEVATFCVEVGTIRVAAGLGRTVSVAVAVGEAGTCVAVGVKLGTTWVLVGEGRFVDVGAGVVPPMMFPFNVTPAL